MLVHAPPARVITDVRASAWVQAALERADGPVQVIGSFPTACYLRLPAGDVVAVLTRDAVALPIGLVLPYVSRTCDLSGLPGSGSVRDGRLDIGALSLRPEGDRPVAVRPAGRPDRRSIADCLAHVGDRGELPGCPDFGLPGGAVASAVTAVIGRGPGLTPAGDDLLCGYLTGCHLFGCPDERAEQAVLSWLDRPVAATTELSAQLLRRACTGEGVPELQRLAHALCSDRRAPAQPGALRQALAAVLAIGHSSGPALARGLLLAGERSGSGRGAVTREADRR